MDRSVEDLLQYPTGLSAEAIEALAEFSGIGLFNLHIPSGEIRLNRNITRLAGYEPGDLPHTGNTKEMLTFGEDRLRVDECMEALFRGETDHYQIEYRMRRRDGSIVSVKESAIVYERDENGAPVRIAAMAQDLSKLRWAEEKARAMEAEILRLGSGLDDNALVRQNHMLRAVNAAATMIIGGFHQDYETVLRQSLQIFAESIQADQAFIWRNYDNGGRLSCFLRCGWGKDGLAAGSMDITELAAYDDLMPGWRDSLKERSSIRCLISGLPDGMKNLPGVVAAKSILLAPLYLHGEFWGLLGFGNKTDERIFTADEAEIMTSGALVIASSISRNETFKKLNEARDEAMASTRAKGEFLSRMSHEIRTPMNAIIGMTTIAKKTKDPERIRYCLDKVDASSRQLLSLINDILDMSKIDSGKLEIVNAPFNFETMIQNVFNVIQVKLDEKRQELRVDFREVFTRMAVSDELRLTQVLINLLNNAVKFTPDGGIIRLGISLERISDEKSRLHVEVQDTGIGISPENQKKLFQSFEQADGGITRSYGGTGLGLAICKRIINLMGGDIWIESEEGKGSNFIFNVEVEWGEKLLTKEEVRNIPGDMKVLVVDDAQDVLEYFTNILDSFSVACDSASNGIEALKAVEESKKSGEPYQMVFIDWNMPGMNGGETANEIRRLLGEDVVCVMISVSDWADIEHDAKRYGVANFLSKPVLPSMLYNTIVKLSDNTLVKPSANGEDKHYDWSGHTILLAEDVEINREIIITVLDETGVKIECAADGKQALDKFAENPDRYSLILMDVQMPIMDGLTATRKIRALETRRAKTIPILAMTANAFKEDAEACREAGMDAHIAKPIDVDRLYTELDTYLS